MKHSIRTFNLYFLKSYSSSDGQIRPSTSFPVSCYVCDSFRSSDFLIDVPKGIYLLDDSKPRGAFQLHLSALQQIPRVLTREGETLMEEPESKTVFAFHKDKAPCPLANEAVAAVWQQPRVTHCGVTQAQAELKTANKKVCVFRQVVVSTHFACSGIVRGNTLHEWRFGPLSARVSACRSGCPVSSFINRNNIIFCMYA